MAAGPPQDRIPPYWIYAVERGGALAETEWFGDRAWYSEGANWLVGAQNPDGTWGHGNTGERILDTCWAILFLRRSTRHIALKKPPLIFTK